MSECSAPGLWHYVDNCRTLTLSGDAVVYHICLASHGTHIKGVAQKSTEMHMFTSDFTRKNEW